MRSAITRRRDMAFRRLTPHTLSWATTVRLVTQHHFVSTRQEDCLACHSTVQHHFATDLFGHDYFVGDTCQDCHREHNGPEAITRSDQATCTGCHTDLERSGYPSLLLSATDFESNHPDFMISTLRMQEDKSWQSIRFNLSDEGLTEVSNLKFLTMFIWTQRG